LLRGDVVPVRRVMASRPYELVFEAAGSHRNLVEQGVITEEEMGSRFEPRARAAILSTDARKGASRAPEDPRLTNSADLGPPSGPL
jgi:hypothetical protein